MSHDRNRDERFRLMFKNAASDLGCSSYREIESLKARGRGYATSADYAALLEELKPLHVATLAGGKPSEYYHGRAWRVTDGELNSVIIVEHETGLEILYVAGAVASIAGLVPLVLNLWNRLRDHEFPFRSRRSSATLERRTLDEHDRVRESPSPPPESVALAQLVKDFAELNQRLSRLEEGVSSLTQDQARRARTHRKKKTSGRTRGRKRRTR